MIFRQLNPKFCKTYLLGNEETKKVIFVDPVLEQFNDYIDLLDKEGMTLTHVIDTHTHADHISACSALKDEFDCEYVMHENAPAKCVTVKVKDGEILNLNGIEMKILHTPGHTMDSISLVIKDKLLSGDFLFLDDGGAGRDDLPGGSPAMHWESINKIYDLPENLVVYPAHDYRDRKPSTLQVQKGSNPHLKVRTKEEFVIYLEDLKLGPADWMKDVLNANYTCAKDPGNVWIPVDAPACEVKGTLEPSVNEMEVEYIEAKELVKKIKEEKPLLLDVREPSELTGELGAIQGIINIPIGSLIGRMKELEEYKNKPIIVICRSGARATTGAQILLKSGWTNVKVLKGGMIEYLNQI